MKFMYELANYEAVVVYEPYTYSFGPRKPLNLVWKTHLRRVARTMMDLPYSYNLEKRIDYFRQAVTDYKIDGVILHENMSCRPSSTGMMDLKEAMQRDCGIPVLILQCDMNDPRAYAEGPIKTRIEGFVELMERKAGNRVPYTFLANRGIILPLIPFLTGKGKRYGDGHVLNISIDNS